jgi:DNA-directed RNA polymerase specialized sigma24 family protein
MLDAERRAAVRDGLAELAESHRALLGLLVADPPIAYQHISDQLGLPIGSIGPTRARCLRKLAATTSIQALELGRGDRASPDAA